MSDTHYQSKRLVYSPRAYVFIKDQHNQIHDLTRYVVSGSVTRLVDQVSTAEISFRNPQHLFTVHQEDVIKDGKVVGTQVVEPKFLPMDPITIYLRRIKGYPVRVFTGFLDRTPYKQLFPGVVTIKASCTLKRLMHTYFDPALPYTQSFLVTYGWIPYNGKWVSLTGMQEFQPPGTTANGTILDGGIKAGSSVTDKTKKGEARKVGPAVGTETKNVVVFGDSLAQNASYQKAMRSALDGYSVSFDTKSDEDSAAALEQIKRRAKDLPSTVVISVGTNDDPTDTATFAKNVQDIIDTLGVKRHIIWYNLSGFDKTGNALSPLNQVLFDASQKNFNLTVADWNAAVSENNLTMDNTQQAFPSSSGYSQRAAIGAKSVKSGALGPAGQNNKLQPPKDIDGSLGKLLHVTLQYIGNWNPDNVYVEAMPEGIFDRMSELAAEFADDNKEFIADFKELMKSVLGTASQGSSDGSSGSAGSANLSTSTNGNITSGPVKGVADAIAVIRAVADKVGGDPLLGATVALIEESYSDSQAHGAGPYYGWLDWDNEDGPPGSYAGHGVTRTMKGGSHDLGFAMQSFYEAAANVKKKNPGASRQLIATTVQGTIGSSGNSLYNVLSQYQAKEDDAKKYLAKYSGTAQLQGGGGTDSNTTAANTNNPNWDKAPHNTNTTVKRASRDGSNKTGTNDQLKRNPKNPHGKGGYTESAAGYARENIKDNTNNLAQQLFDLGYYCTSANDGTHISGSLHYSGLAIDFGDAKNDVVALSEMMYPFRDQLEELWIPPETKLPYAGFYNRGVKGGSDHDNHVHIGLIQGKYVDLGNGSTAGSGTTGTPVTADSLDLHPTDLPIDGVGARSGKPSLIILHSTEGGSDHPGGEDLKNLRTVLIEQGLSVHVGVDSEGNSARYCADDRDAQHVAAFNNAALGIEQCGKAAQSSWPSKQTDETAKWIAYWSAKHNIPIRKGQVQGSTVIRSGILRHSDLGSAGGGHSDPGDGYPFDSVLAAARELRGQVGIGGSNTAGAGGGGGSQAGAGALFASLDLPSFEDAVGASYLTGDKSLLNDKPLLPFIQQLCSASLRHFQSLPDGRFYAFYPDYFGEFNQHPAYWNIDDIEILDGKIELTDDALVTHMYVVGDTINPLSNSTEFPIRAAMASGVVTIFNAFMADRVLSRDKARKYDAQKAAREAKKTAKSTVKTNESPNDPNENPSGMGILLDRNEAANFLDRYGARPLTEDMPMIKSNYFEMFLAYQKFLLAWSKQFSTPFTFTFMPEIFPGGKLAFPNHGLQMYVEDVTHSWDYESGFTTTATLSAPSVYGANTDLLPPNMVQALLKPSSETKVDALTTKPKTSTG